MRRTDTAAPREAAHGRTGRFRRGVIIYLCVLAVIWIGVLAVLWRYLARFQAEMDAEAARQAAEQAQAAYDTAVYRAPQLAFEAWQNTRTADFWTDLWYSTASNDLDDREQVTGYMGQLFASGAVQAFKDAAFTQEAPVYLLKHGDTTLARVTLSGSGLDWQVTDVALTVPGTHAVTVWAAEGCRVLCNGRLLDDTFRAAENGVVSPAIPPAAQLENPVSLVCYTVDGLLLEPEITVEPPEGFGLTQDADGRYLLSPERDTSAYAEWAVKFVRAYLNYYMSGEENTEDNLRAALAYLTPDTQAYQELLNTYYGVVWNHIYSDIDTSKTAAGPVILWADNCFSVDVSYDADCTTDGQHVDFADATMRIYFLSSGNGYDISHFEVIS